MSKRGSSANFGINNKKNIFANLSKSIMLVNGVKQKKIFKDIQLKL